MQSEEENPQQKWKKMEMNKDGNIYMTDTNLQRCLANINQYETPELNDFLRLHFCGFYKISNLQKFTQIHTLFLNNNVIHKIEGLDKMEHLVFLNLSNNRIEKIEGLKGAGKLKILDLSHNKIKKIQGVKHLPCLETLKVSNNYLSNFESLKELESCKTVTFINLNDNPIVADTNLYKILSKMASLLTLYLQGTQFCRGVARYRKETICAIKTITYLDERPVSKEERMLAEAWKQGGIMKQKEVRKLIHQSEQKKRQKILADMKGRREAVEKLREQLYKTIAKNEIEELAYLKRVRDDLVEDLQIKKINIKIQQLELYLEQLKEDVKYMGVESWTVPLCINDEEFENEIHIYNVPADKIEKVRDVFYPDTKKKLVSMYQEPPKELRWVPAYEQLLQEVFAQYKGDMDLVLPVFNMRVHRLDESSRRKARRFTQQELSEMKLEKKIKFQGEAQLNQLD